MNVKGKTIGKKEKGPQQNLNFTSGPGTKSGTSLTHRAIPNKGATGSHLPEEVASVLEEFNSVQTLKAVLPDNTNANIGCERSLVKIKSIVNFTLSVATFHQNKIPFRAVLKHLDSSTKGLLGKLCRIDHHNYHKWN